MLDDEDIEKIIEECKKVFMTKVEFLKITKRFLRDIQKVTEKLK